MVSRNALRVKGRLQIEAAYTVRWIPKKNKRGRMVARGFSLLRGEDERNHGMSLSVIEKTPRSSKYGLAPKLSYFRLADDNLGSNPFSSIQIPKPSKSPKICPFSGCLVLLLSFFHPLLIPSCLAGLGPTAQPARRQIHVRYQPMAPVASNLEVG